MSAKKMGATPIRPWAVWFFSLLALSPLIHSQEAVLMDGMGNINAAVLNADTPAAALYAALRDVDSDASLAALLLAHPEHRHTVRRAQIVDRAPYAEIRDNTIGSDLVPIDMLRCKLAFFGATHFDPRSDRWVRICMFGNAPYPEELQQNQDDDWSYPPLVKGGK